MQPFSVVGLGRFLKENSVEAVVSAFSQFFHSVSYKYQKKSRLVLIDKVYHHVLNKELTSQYRIIENTTFLNLENQQEIELIYTEGSVMLLPRKVNSSSIIKEAFHYGLPVLGYAHSGHDNLLDASSGIRVSYESDHQAIEAMADRLRLLNYDPEAIKMLRSGATKKYATEISWPSARRQGQ